MSRDADDDLRGLGDSLRTRTYARAHEHHGSLGSTNDRAAAWLREGGPHGLVVTADAQTAGRGRLGRTWSSPPRSGLYVSLGLRVPTPRQDLSAIGLAVGLGLFEGLGELEGLGLKWPNDLLVGDRKLAGILCESRWGAEVELVVGFGINVRRAGIEPAVADRAIALEDVGEEHRRVPLLARLLLALEGRVEGFLLRGFGLMREAYAAANVQNGQRVRVVAGQETFEGIAAGVDASGALLVDTGGGRRVVHAADVTLVR